MTKKELSRVALEDLSVELGDLSRGDDPKAKEAKVVQEFLSFCLEWSALTPVEIENTLKEYLMGERVRVDGELFKCRPTNEFSEYWLSYYEDRIVSTVGEFRTTTDI